MCLYSSKYISNTNSQTSTSGFLIPEVKINQVNLYEYIYKLITNWYQKVIKLMMMLNKVKLKFIGEKNKKYFF